VNRSAATVTSLAMVLALIVSACTGGASPTPAATAAPTEAATATEGASPTPSPVVPTSLITPGTVVDCVDIEYAPMEMFPSADVTDPAQAIGFDVDSAKAVAALWGLKLEIRNTTFPTLIPDLQANRCDIVWTALFVSAKRLAVVEAVPYLTTGHEVLVPAGNPEAIKTLDDLCGKKVSIQAGGLVEELINTQSGKCTAAGKPAIDIQAYVTVAEEMQQIVQGRVSAVWETDTQVGDFIGKNPGKYEIAFVVSRDDAYGVYFQKGHSDISDALIAAFAAIKGDGSWATIATTYGQDASLLAPACPHDTATMGCHAGP
jgi:polar amino acid transport system substrate-binding protein